MNRLFGVTVIVAFLSQNASGALTYKYTGFVSHVSSNQIGAPIDEGDPVNIAFSFDPNSPDANPADFRGRYLMTGSDINFEVSVGRFSSIPINNFVVSVVTSGDSVTSDQYNFLNQAGATMRLDFPGLANSISVAFFFRGRIPPLTSDDLFVTPPNPAEYEDARMVIGGSSQFLSLQIALDPQFVPEPTSSIVLCLGGVLCLICSRARRS